jgi:hypothetical protein
MIHWISVILKSDEQDEDNEGDDRADFWHGNRMNSDDITLA